MKQIMRTGTLAAIASSVVVISSAYSQDCPDIFQPRDKGKLEASDGAIGDQFGIAVSASGDATIIGANFKGSTASPPSNAGGAYIYRINGITFVEEAILEASDGAANDEFGSDVGISGAFAIVGAPQADTGAAYVFEYNGTTWPQVDKLVSPAPESANQFGWSVAVDDDYAVIGELLGDQGGPGLNTGRAYVFRRVAGEWTFDAPDGQLLAALDADTGDQFGYDVAIDGDVIAIGARLDDQGGISAGAVYIFRRTGTTWSQEAKFSGSSGDQLGFSVAVSGNTVIAGAPVDDGSLGSASVFHYNGTTWSQQTVLTRDPQDLDDRFGHAVSVSGNVAFIGAIQGGGGTGIGVMFTRSGSTWTQEESLLGCDTSGADQAGFGIAAAGSLGVMGAPGHDKDGESNVGSAYVFDLAAASGGDADGDGLTDAQETALQLSTHPCLSPSDDDSDDDGAFDGTEVNTLLCTNPCDADSDDDGLNEGAEMTLMTDPCDADTDDDGVDDSEDDQPFDPGVSSGALEQMTRESASDIRDVALATFDAPNNNACKGRRTALSNKLDAAANAIAAGDCATALAELNDALEKVDGQSQPPDWIVDDPDLEGDADPAEAIRSEIQLLIAMTEMSC